MFNFVSSQSSSRAASHEVALFLAKEMKPFREDKLVKACAIKIAEAFWEKKVAEKFKTLSLSHQTVARRVVNLSQHVPVSCKLKTHVNKCSYFSLALDESINVTDINQLTIFARVVNENFEFHDDLQAIHPLTGRTKRSDIWMH